MDKGGVKQRRTRFIKEYLIDQNATRAAIAAGYAESSAAVTGSQLIRNPKIKATIEAENDKVNKKLELTVERVKLEIARLAYYDPAAFWNPNGTAKPLHEIDEDSRRAIAGFETAELFEGSGEDRALAGYIKKFKLVSKDRALELAGRHLKMFTDKVEVSDSGKILARLLAGRQRTAKRA